MIRLFVNIFPLTKEKILEKGYKYKEPETKIINTILAHQLPAIKDASEEILKKSYNANTW